MIDVQQTTEDGNNKQLAPARPLGLFITVVRDKGGTDEIRHIRAFKALLDEEGYEDFRDAVIDEWARIKWSTAFAAANPPTAAELRLRLEQQKREQEEERKAIDGIKFKIVKRALSLVMPNGKTLAKCTGAECAAFGGFFAKISTRVGANDLVGDVLTTRDLISPTPECAMTEAAIELVKAYGIKEAVGVAWYTPATWEQLAAIPEARIQKSYQDFVRGFENIVRGFAAQGIATKKMPIDINQMFAWCHQHGYVVDAHGRAAYGAVQMSAPDDPNVPVIDNTRVAG